MNDSNIWNIISVHVYYYNFNNKEMYIRTQQAEPKHQKSFLLSPLHCLSLFNKVFCIFENLVAWCVALLGLIRESKVYVY